MEKVANADSVDEIVLFGRRKVAYICVRRNPKKNIKKNLLIMDCKAVSMKGAQGAPKKAENAYLCCCKLPRRSEYLIGSPAGYIYMCSGTAALRVFKAHASAIGDICVLDETRIVTASFDKTLSVIQIDGVTFITELTSQDIVIPESDFEMGPRCVVYANTSNEKLVYVGTKSNQIIVSDLKGTQVAMVVDGHDDQIWGLCTYGEFICTGGWDNVIKIWNKDTKRNIETYQFPQTTDEKGRLSMEKVVTCAWSADGSLIATGTESSKVTLFAFDVKGVEGKQLQFLQSYEIPPNTKNASSEAVDYCRFSADNKFLAVAHMNSSSYIFDISQRTLDLWPQRLREVAAPSHLRWSEDNTMLAAFTRDYEISYWKLDTGSRKCKRVTNIPDPDVVMWTGDPLIAGWDVQGLYQDEWDGTDLNDAAVTGTGSDALIASGDDYGIVRLHNYPCINNKISKMYHCHSAFVVGVEWTGPGDYLLTVGGNDYAIFQWKLSRTFRGKVTTAL